MSFETRQLFKMVAHYYPTLVGSMEIDVDGFGIINHVDRQEALLMEADILHIVKERFEGKIKDVEFCHNPLWNYLAFRAIPETAIIVR